MVCASPVLQSRWSCLASTRKWAHGAGRGVAEYPEPLSWLRRWLSPVTSLNCDPAVAAATLWDPREIPPPLGGVWHLLCGSRPEAGFGTTLTGTAFTCTPCLCTNQVSLLPKPQAFCCLGARYFHCGATAIIKVSSISVPNVSCWAITPAFSLARRRK